MLPTSTHAPTSCKLHVPVSPVFKCVAKVTVVMSSVTLAVSFRSLSNIYSRTLFSSRIAYDKKKGLYDMSLARRLKSPEIAFYFKYMDNGFLQGTCIFFVILNLSRDARKPVFGVSDQVRHKPTCTSSEKS